MKEVVGVTRIEFNSREAQDAFNVEMRFAHFPQSEISYQEVCKVAFKFQDKFDASFRAITSEAHYDEKGFFDCYKKSNTVFFKA